jgi:hypothetical protein
MTLILSGGAIGRLWTRIDVQGTNRRERSFPIPSPSDGSDSTCCGVHCCIK